MNKIVITYSFTGNNGKLAKALADRLNAEIIIVQEKNKRSVLTILLDTVFNRTPKIDNIGQHLDQGDQLIFVAPVWFGKIASPLRPVFSFLKNKTIPYVFISLSAGADGINPNLEKEASKRTGKAPLKTINLLIRNLLPAEPKPSRQMLDAYRLTDQDTEFLVEKLLNEFKN